MNRAHISKYINSLLADISKLSNTLCAMNNTDIERYPDNYGMLSTDAALHSELIACKMRHLLYGSTNMKKSEYLTSAGVVQGIRISEKDGVLNIFLPRLMPRRKGRKNSEFLTDPLYFTLSQYADSHELPKFQHCVICFSHIYSKELSLSRVRDYDNLELKQLLDVIAAFVMEDDSGLLCDAYNTTELGEQDCTCISVMGKERFFEWIAERENRLKSISDF